MHRPGTVIPDQPTLLMRSDEDTRMSATPPFSEEPHSEEPEDLRVERWTYGGMRSSTKNTKLRAWIDPAGTELLYTHKPGQIVGCWYEVHVRRSPCSERVTRYGHPRFIGQSDDRELITRLAAEDRAHDQHLALIQRQRKAKTDNPLDAKIDKLARLVATVPAPHRAGLTAYILCRLTRVW